MSIFGGSSKATGDKPAVTGKGLPAATSLSIVGGGMTVRGDLETDGVVKVEGTVDGHVKARAQVLVAKGGVVHGDIDTIEVVVGGTVDGSIRASDRVEIQAGASVQGDVTTRRISVAEGGILNGQIRMGEGEWNREERGGESKSAAAAPALVGGLSRPSAVPMARIALPPRPAGAEQTQ